MRAAGTWALPAASVVCHDNLVTKPRDAVRKQPGAGREASTVKHLCSMP
jgi:hypothetical protein